MAFLAELGALTDELVTAVTSTSPSRQPQRFQACRQKALRSIRNRDALQTNPFVVEQQLHGLVERFSVVGRDGLSEALRKRLEGLSRHATRFTPEVLHLLLELSDQPVQKSSLAALERLHHPQPEAQLALRWEDIAREDGWAQDRGLWNNVDFADSSSSSDDDDDDDEYSQSEQTPAESDDTSLSISQTVEHKLPKDLILPDPDGSALDKIQAAQQWRHAAQPKDAAGRPLKIPVSEHQILREALFLLSGLPTSLFGPDCTPVPKFQLSNVAWDTYRALVNSFAEYGRVLLPLRRFCETVQDVPLVQAFQNAVQRCLGTFNKQMSTIQARYVDIKTDTVVSLIALNEELRPILVPLVGLSDVVRKLQEERFAHSFRFLELMYDATCMAQQSGDESTYTYLGHIFFDCFRVYIRPIRQWMEGGELTAGDKTFFVAEASATVPLHLVWRDKFHLRKSQQGQLHAPVFLQPAVTRIFNTGKSVVVLKHLGRFQQIASNGNMRLPEPPLDFASICGPQAVAFAPFSELFHGAFDRWVQSKHLSTSSNLSTLLFESCGLLKSLDALHQLYYMSDGSLADTFTLSIFASLDALSTTWTDRFTLTELAQEAWSPSTKLESHGLSATVAPEHLFARSPGQARCTVRNSLPGVRVSYKLIWPVRLVITDEVLVHYQAVFTLLLQVRRAAAILTTSSALLKSSHAGGTSLADQDATSYIHIQPSGRHHHIDHHVHQQQQAYFSLRSRLLWFTSTLHTYLATLVLLPETARLRATLQQDAEDIDAMIGVHAQSAKRIVDQACLGTKLRPIKECILDVLDLAIKLEDARAADAQSRAAEAARYSLTGFGLGPGPGGQQGQQQQQHLLHFRTPRRNLSSSGVFRNAGRGGPSFPTSELRPPPSTLRGVYLSPREKEREEDETILFEEKAEEGEDEQQQQQQQQQQQESNANNTSHYVDTSQQFSSPVRQRQERQHQKSQRQRERNQQLQQQQQQNNADSYAEVLVRIRADFDRHVRFIADGLRGVARASVDAAAVKWDMLAEMLEMGIR
ncbi:Spc98 family-domain-containing protein [Coniella lustricola]|uniref:Spindle pole body component n=1 Tax=Coniella lustricola TaxID=2025994 RepID=A0A2T3AEV4_9PEZI|nr:Spc98 family-domain-containing protein [Coniella lustricola]